MHHCEGHNRIGVRTFERDFARLGDEFARLTPVWWMEVFFIKKVNVI